MAGESRSFLLSPTGGRAVLASNGISNDLGGWLDRSAAVDASLTIMSSPEPAHG